MALSDGANVAATQTLSGSEAAASAGALAISSMFSDVLANRPVNVAGIERAARMIAENVAEEGLSDWLQAVRQHHEGTFQTVFSLPESQSILAYASAWQPRPSSIQALEMLTVAQHDLPSAGKPHCALSLKLRQSPRERLEG